jgi:hypothetical protein
MPVMPRGGGLGIALAALPNGVSATVAPPTEEGVVLALSTVSTVTILGALWLSPWLVSNVLALELPCYRSSERSSTGTPLKGLVGKL